MKKLNNIKQIGLFLILASIVKISLAQAPLPFINLNANKIIHSNDSSNFLKFYQKMDDLKMGKTGRVSIMHIGGSHVQAGFWTETLKTHFQQLNNYQGGGAFAFPFQIVKTNNPGFYKTFSNGNWKRCRSVKTELCTKIGLAGVAAVSNDSACDFGIKLETNQNLKSITQLKVFHNFNPSFEINIHSRFRTNYRRNDFPQEGYSLFAFQTPIDSVQFTLTRKDTINKDFVLYGFSLENDTPGYFMSANGANGASTQSFLRCELFESQLRNLSPDLVIFSLGVNDSQGKNFSRQEFMNHYDSLVMIVKRINPNCAILFTTITDNYIYRKGANKNSIYGSDVIFDVAKKHNASVYDLNTVMGGYKSIYKWYKAGYARKDKVHFTAKGYGIIGDLMWDAINRSYKSNSKI